MRLTNHIFFNRIFLPALALSFNACDILKPAQTTLPNNRGTVQNPVTTGNPSGPSTAKNPTGRVDTVVWKEDKKAKPPIVTDGGKVSPTNPTGTTGNPTPTDRGTGTTTAPTLPGEPMKELKTTYDLSIPLPFFRDKYNSATGANYDKSLFALDFYAGVKLAMDSLSYSNINLNVNIVDTKPDFTAVLNQYEVSKTDVMLGPVEKDNLPAAIAFSNDKKKTVVSPYFPSLDLEGENPNFVQVKPSLKTHCEAITNHTRARYKPELVVLLARQQDGESARFKYFQDKNALISRSSTAPKFREATVDEKMIDISKLVSPTLTTVFVVPSWNEAFVGALLKKIDEHPNKRNIVIYGMPQWMDFAGMNDYFDRLKVRISSSTFVDVNRPEVRIFRQRFVDKFGKMPNNDAYLGYDCALYFGEAMKKYGSKFAYFLDREPRKLLHTKFLFEPVYRSTTTGTDDFGKVMKYENKYVNILRYSGGFSLEE
jgi:ABC-type branched-subunit amino acid transport system substrate-binding protein